MIIRRGTLKRNIIIIGVFTSILFLSTRLIYEKPKKFKDKRYGFLLLYIVVTKL